MKPLVESFLRERGLELSAEKTKITHIEEGFDFLGQNVRRYSHGKLWVKPSKKNIHTFLEKVRSHVKKSLSAPAWRLITDLNRMVRGWAHVSPSRQEHAHLQQRRLRAIFIALWRWALRRHPRKGKRWLMRRYFARRGGRSWCFFGSRRKLKGNKGRPCGYSTRLPCHSPSVHQGEASLEPIPSGVGDVLRGTREQAHGPHPCGSCSPPLPLADAGRQSVLRAVSRSLGRPGWHSHHVVPKVLGGHDGATNRQLLHPECHRQLHSRLSRTTAAASRKRRLEGLSRVSWKLSRTVLRGAVGGNADCLLDPKEGKPPKQPYAFELVNGQTFALAGLWDAWKDKDGRWLQSFAIVTTQANETMSRIHPRMPVILPARDYDRWLDREETERLPLDLLRPFESEAMVVHEANPKVGNVRNNGPEMMRIAAKAAEDGELPL